MALFPSQVIIPSLLRVMLSLRLLPSSPVILRVVPSSTLIIPVPPNVPPDHWLFAPKRLTTPVLFNVPQPLKLKSLFINPSSSIVKLPPEITKSS